MHKIRVTKSQDYGQHTAQQKQDLIVKSACSVILLITNVF